MILSDYVVVLDCSADDRVTFTATANLLALQAVEVYAGDKTAARLTATETGDATYRLITGITDRFYTVKNLEAEGTYIYKVKALFADGTESAWSNVEDW